MKDQDTRNPKPKELVGSKDLRESFKDGNIRGSWFINGVEMHQFEANSPASVVSQINAKTAQHFVTSEIDDGGHLVLIDKSGADIQIALGAPYVDAPPATTGDAAKDVLNHLKTAAKADTDKSKDKANKVLESLGLEGSAAETTDPGIVPPGFETGRSADDRKKAWEAANPKPQSTDKKVTSPFLPPVKEPDRRIWPS